MLEDIHFQRNAVVNVDAAVVGISRKRWMCVSEHVLHDEAYTKMRQTQFDVLPVDGDGRVRFYYRTKTWNDFSSVERCDLNHHDVVHYRTSLREIIKGFATEKRPFYFLGNDNDVIGLISIANLNSRQVKTYLYSLISELELLLSAYLDRSVSDGDLYAHVFGNTSKPDSVNLKNTYDEGKRSGFDVRLVEYLYLTDLSGAVTHFGLHTPLGYSKTKFKDKLNSINDLRNAVSHPARSLVDSEEKVSTLWTRLDLIEEVIFKLKRLVNLGGSEG